ncbi:glycoside hydrolase family 64 protein [Xylanimonas oleitrophica]|uniref:glycoside hydrolase family 64 protein n=1 Tax=Xylanimonas oleitrophica TaxID=2607479 RepID=UPI001C54C0BC|nr:glycoside hydrolase family 64 protein [Xylanimonas oleitrophica]
MSPVRKLIGTLAALAVAAVTAVGVAAPAAAVPDTIPLTITNDSDRGGPVYLYVLGEQNGRLGYADASGAFHPWPSAGEVPVPAPDASIPGPAQGESITIQMPKLSGRVYFSYGEKLNFQIVLDGRLVQPAVQNPTDPNRDIMFSWTEYTLNDAGLWINSTQVDFFSAPYQTGLRKADGTVISTGMLKPDGFQNVISALDGTPGWDNLVQRAPNGEVLRVLSPGHAIGVGQIAADVLDDYVDRVWAHYSNESMTVRPYSYDPGTVFTGRVSGDVMTFTDGSGAQVATFNKPSSDSIFGCHNDLAAPNDDVGAISRTLCAGFHRSTLLLGSEQPTQDPAAFYQDPVTNYYAKFVHEQMVDGRAYAFAFDDVVAQESLVHDGNPTAAYIKLDPFAGATTPIEGSTPAAATQDAGTPAPAAASETATADAAEAPAEEGATAPAGTATADASATESETASSGAGSSETAPAKTEKPKKTFFVQVGDWFGTLKFW